MKTVYACTFIEKTVQEDDFENGCNPTTLACVMQERCNAQADSLAALIEALGERFCLDIDDVFLADEDGKVARIGYNRLENGDGDEPSAEQKRRWKQGKDKLYLADYDFLIEKRVVSPVPVEEFQVAGITTHD